MSKNPWKSERKCKIQAEIKAKSKSSQIKIKPESKSKPKPSQIKAQIKAKAKPNQSQSQAIKANQPEEASPASPEPSQPSLRLGESVTAAAPRRRGAWGGLLPIEGHPGPWEAPRDARRARKRCIKI